MPIINITKTTKTPGSRGTLTKIAKALGVSLSLVSDVNRGKKKSARVRAALTSYQRTGRIAQTEQL